VLLDGHDVTRVQPHKRPVNTVFQRSTLFPHLNVADNVAFGLRVAGIPRNERERRVTAGLALVRLEEFSDRRAHELSGGQLQRVALARALVNRPRVLLLDEPLAALDLKIRLEMEVELRRVHRETGATFIYVTHDQREALALSDRIAVLNHGHVEQIGTPDEIYRAPSSPFAARFVGDANVLPVAVVRAEDAEVVVQLAGSERRVRPSVSVAPGNAWLVVRPEVVRVSSSANGAGISGIVRDVAFRGSGFTYRIDVEGLGEPVKAETGTDRQSAHSIGTPVSIEWDPEACSLLPR
jgi:ABC-type Fe3+/spermidine/putrescine transport system ATPase subunit